MQYLLKSTERLAATVKLPASKSISNRVLIIHALAGGTQPPDNLSDCDDTKVMLRALQGRRKRIDIKAAGTAMRFLTAYLSVTEGQRTLTGTERMRHRPIRILVDALRSLGADIAYLEEEGYPPLRICGKRLTGKETTLEGSVSSQYISALLMIGPVLPQGLRLHLTGNVVSRPYINLTLDIMREFGATATWVSESEIQVEGGGYKDVAFTVENDWSAASYWYEMMAFCWEDSEEREHVTMEGLRSLSSQGDSRCRRLFSRLGVMSEPDNNSMCLLKGDAPVKRMDEDLVDVPDLAQTLVVTCCLMNIPFRFTGLQSLRIKETDRIEALVTELRKLGYVLRTTETGTTLSWDNERCEPEDDPVICTYDDHRMAMSFAPVCMLRPSIRIDHPEVVSKSYPAFWKELRKAGFIISKKP